MSRNLDQNAILNKFTKWIKIKSKEDPDSYNDEVVKNLIKDFKLGFCSGFSWLHRIRMQRGEEEQYFYQIENIVRWNGSKRTLTSELDHLFNQFVNFAIFAHQDTAIKASTSYPNAQNAAQGIKFQQDAASIGRILAPSDEIYARTSYESDYIKYNKAETRQKLESLLQDTPNAMIYIAGECWSLRKNPTKHDYHAVDFGMTEVNGEKKYWLYDPNHPKGTRYYDDFGKVFKALQRAFFYFNKQRSFPMTFQRYELLDLVQQQQETKLKTIRSSQNPSSKSTDEAKEGQRSKRRHRAKAKSSHNRRTLEGQRSKGKHRAKAKSSHNRRTLTFGYQDSKKSQLSFSQFDRDKAAELSNIIQKMPANGRITLEKADEYQSIQIEKVENGFVLWLSEDKQNIFFNDLSEVFNKIKAYDQKFWQEMDIVTVFTQQLTDESKQKASLELELSIREGDEQGVRILVENGAYDGFSPNLEENLGHNLLTLAMSQKKVYPNIVEFLLQFDKQNNLGLANHIFDGSPAKNGFDILWFALTSGDVNMLKLMKEYFPEATTCRPISEGSCQGLSPLHVAIMYNESAEFIQALIDNYPEIAKQKPEGELFGDIKDLLMFSQMWGNTNPKTLAVLTKYLELNNESSASASASSSMRNSR